MRSLWFNNGNTDKNLAPRNNVYSHGLQSLFDDFFKDANTWAPYRETTFVPKLNVTENEKEYKVLAELPGLEEKDFEVILEGDLLKIKGEKKTQTEDKNESYHRVESSYGSFERVLRFPEEVSPEKAKASFKNGLLTLVIEKNKEGTRVHKLKIES